MRAAVVFSAVLASIVSALPAAAADGWYDDLEDGLAAASRTGRPVVVHFYASWCGPCRRMEADVFPSPQVRGLLRDEVIGVKLDADTNRSVSAAWGVGSIPADVVLTPDGTPVAVMSGYKPAAAYAGRLSRLASRVSAGRALIADKPADKAAQDPGAGKPAGRKLVGLGGYCPVTVATDKRWARGSWEHAVEHFGVTYLFVDAASAGRFETRPIRYTPRLSGCDPVAFAESKEVVPGSIATAALYDGAIVLFADAANRERFGRDPAKYLAIRQVMLPEELILALGPDGAGERPILPRFASLPRFTTTKID
ncbi:MAG: thioredoxin family protein [Planctomycetota bacterium]